MEKHREILMGATRAFEAGGFRGTGVDQILTSSGASTRTLYKHFGSRDGLVLEVLKERHQEFMRRLEAVDEAADPIGSLFDTLEQWLVQHGARGCMLLRAHSEYSSANKDVVALVRQQKREFAGEIAQRVKKELGHDDRNVATQVWMIFEGATAAASVSDLTVVPVAKHAASVLLAVAKGQSK
ncbi:TetR/AcrR family transcriptional regulator [Pseudoroseomonas wenyumeiae]